MIQDSVERAFDQFLGDVVAALADEPVDFEWVRELIGEMGCCVLRFEREAQGVSLGFLAALETALNRIEDLR